MFLVSTFIAAAVAAATPIDASKTKVEFLAVGYPSALKIRGKAKDGATGEAKLEGKQLAVTAKVKLDSLDTGIELRNRHMKEKYLETAKHPDATLVVPPTTLQPGEQPFKGTLTLHGVTKPVTGTLKYEPPQVQLAFPLTLSDFSIAIPSYLGIKVAEKVDVTAELKL